MESYRSSAKGEGMETIEKDMRSAVAWDDGADPDVRLRAIATELASMDQAGELERPDADTLRLLRMLPVLLLSIAGDVFVLRRPTGRVVRLDPALSLIEGGQL
jgi:hypothetical protein